MFKKVLTLLLALICLLGLAACSTHANKSATFQVETGDKVKVQVDLKAGYDLTMTVPFEISRDEETIIFGTFGQPDAYDTYYQLVQDDPYSTLLEEDSRNGNAYFFYTVSNPESQITEYNYFVKVGNSQTVVIMGSTAEREEVEAAFAAAVISLAED